MTVKVNVAESDLPEGINQLLNLTAQATTDVEKNFPYTNIVAESGKTMLTSIGDSTTLILTLSEADGTPMPNQTISVGEDLPNIFQLPVGPIATDQNGQARAEVSLIVMPDATPVMKTITANATVQTAQYDAVDAMGTIRIEVDGPTS